jgi:outer membrane receptor for ferric coprogen and ferric-rhodotorulic acid
VGVGSEKDTWNKDYKGSLQLLVDPADRVKILVGALVDRGLETDKVTISGGKTLDPANVQVTDFTKFLSRYALTYDVVNDWGAVDDGKAYFNYSQGFQPQVLINTAGNPVSYPQNMNQYEVGFKSDLLHRAIGASIAAYTNKITNIPVNSAYLGQGTLSGFGTTSPGGTQSAKGIEAEMVGQILPGWNLAFNYAYTHTRVVDPNYAFTTPEQSVPINKAALISSYEFTGGPLQGLRLGGTLVKSSNYAFVLGVDNVAKWGQLEAGAFTRLDLNVSYKGIGGVRGLEVYANLHNAFNANVFISNVGSASYSNSYIDKRFFNLGLRYNFF